MKIFAIVLPLAMATLGSARSQESAPKPPEVSAAIDRILETRWTGIKDGAAPLCSDSEFLRRVSLDLRGRIPGGTEVKAFLASNSPSKRLEKIDEYLATDDCTGQLTNWLGQVLFTDYKRFRIQPGKNFNGKTIARLQKDFMAWLREQVAKDVPMPLILKSVLEAAGKTDENAVVLYKLSMYSGEPAHLEFAEQVTKSWLGVKISCARCHEHPFDRWTQEDYYGMAGFFTRHKLKLHGVNGDYCDEVEMIEDPKGGELTNPDTGGQIKPTFLYGGALQHKDPRMPYLAAFMSNREHDQLARNFANRIWAWYMGRGIVHPVDDFNEQNKPSIPELLNVLTTAFAKGKYSLRHLARGICASGAYQRGSARDVAGDVKDFARSTIRQLTVEQLFNSVVVAATGAEGLAVHAGQRGWYDGQMNLVFGPGFGWTEVNYLPGNARQMLLLRNGEAFQDMIRAADGVAAKIHAEQIPISKKVDAAFMAVLGRASTEFEMMRWAKWLDKNKTPEGLQDIVWTLINSTEFVTRH